jgi:hypothetical protein
MVPGHMLPQSLADPIPHIHAVLFATGIVQSKTQRDDDAELPRHSHCDLGP